jgi:hypothetical protein
MHRSPSDRRFPLIAAAAVCALVAALAAPRFAAAGIVPEREQHNVTAFGVLSGTPSQESFPGDTTTPTSPVTATARAPGSTATLDLAFNGGSVVGKADSISGIGPILPGFPLPTQTDGQSNFTLTFSVPQPTPFVLGGSIGRFSGTFTTARGFASVTLADESSVIFARDTTFLIFGDQLPVEATGTFLPGHTYRLSASAQTSLETSPLGREQFTQGTANVTLTVPEPASLALLAPGAMVLLARRRR